MAKIVYNKILPFGSFEAIAIWPLVFVKTWPVSSRRKNHESIHLHQQFEVMVASAIVLFVLCFTCISWWWICLTPFVYYLLYTTEYFIRSIIYDNTDEGYRNISFEQEAIMNEYDFNYLKGRKAFAWIKYLNKKTYKK